HPIEGHRLVRERLPACVDAGSQYAAYEAAQRVNVFASPVHEKIVRFYIYPGVAFGLHVEESHLPAFGFAGDAHAGDDRNDLIGLPADLSRNKIFVAARGG